MSNEEMNKKMEFIVEHQAKFAADIEIIREVQAQDTKLLKEETNGLKQQYRTLSEAVITVVGLVGSLAKGQALADERLNELTQAQAHTDDRINVLVQAQTRTDQRFDLLAQTQTRTDERINLLTESQTHLTESQTRTDERINLLAEAQTRLTESQARTDERLNIFINVVERHIGGNGSPENPA